MQKQLRFFALPKEIGELLTPVLEGTFMYIRIYGDSPSDTRLNLIENINEYLATDVSLEDQFYISAKKLNKTHYQSINFDPARIELVQYLPPYLDIVSNILFYGQLAVKSDWWDRETNIIRVNERVDKFYLELVPLIRSKLEGGMEVINSVTGARMVNRQLYYSKGAALFDGIMKNRVGGYVLYKPCTVT